MPNGTSYAQELWNTAKEIPHADLTTVLVGFGSLAVLLVTRALLPRWPRMLMVVALAIAISSGLDLSEHGAITGDVPTGLFSVGLPGVGFSDTTALVVGALSVIFVGCSESLAAGRATARKHRYELDPNQELVAPVWERGWSVGSSRTAACPRRRSPTSPDSVRRSPR